MKQEPVWDEGTDAAGIYPSGLQPGHDDVPLVGEAREHTVAEAFLELVPEVLDRVVFGTVGWERDDPDVVWQAFVSVGEMEAGSVLDQDMDRGRIAFADLAVKMTEMRQVRGLGEEELTVGQSEADRPVHVAPLVHMLGDGHPPVARQSPDSAGESVEAVAHLVEHPQPHRPPARVVEGFEPYT